MTKKSTIIKNKSIFSTPWFELTARWIKEDPRPYYALKAPDYVSVVALTATGKYILVRQFRPAVGAVTLECPSGTVDPGRTPLQTARQELLEETGYAPGSLRLAGSMRPDTGRMMNRLWVYCAENCVRVPGAVLEKGISTLLASPKQLDGMIGSGRFEHALNVAALAIAQRKFKLP